MVIKKYGNGTAGKVLLMLVSNTKNIAMARRKTDTNSLSLTTILRAPKLARSNRNPITRNNGKKER
jgi:hypothetical protein